MNLKQLRYDTYSCQTRAADPTRPRTTSDTSSDSTLTENEACHTTDGYDLETADLNESGKKIVGIREKLHRPMPGTTTAAFRLPYILDSVLFFGLSRSLPTHPLSEALQKGS